MNSLKEVNNNLWEIENSIRVKEKRKEFKDYDILVNASANLKEISFKNVKIKDKIITKLKDRIQEIITQLVHLCKTE